MNWFFIALAATLCYSSANHLDKYLITKYLREGAAGALTIFSACVGCALWVAGVPEEEQGPWRAFGDELGPLFQIVDDILDGDGVVLVHGPDDSRRLAEEAAERALARLREIQADTLVLVEIVAGLAARTT